MATSSLGDLGHAGGCFFASLPSPVRWSNDTCPTNPQGCRGDQRAQSVGQFFTSHWEVVVAQVLHHNPASDCNESGFVSCPCPSEPWGEGVCCGGGPRRLAPATRIAGDQASEPPPQAVPHPTWVGLERALQASSWVQEVTRTTSSPSQSSGVASAPSGSPLDGGTGSWTPVCIFRVASRPRQWGSGLCTPRGDCARVIQAPGTSAGEHRPLPVTRVFSQSLASSSAVFPVFGTRVAVDSAPSWVSGNTAPFLGRASPVAPMAAILSGAFPAPGESVGARVGPRCPLWP